MQRCSIYKKNDTYYAHADSKTKAGFWVADEPFFSFSPSDDIHEMITKALRGSKLDKETPPRDANLFEPVLLMAKVRSYSTFMKKAKLVCVKLNDKEFSFVPYKNEGGKNGFKPKNDEAIKINESGNIQSAFLEAFERAV